MSNELGVSNWVTITQEDVRAFGVLTRSSERIHDDPEWAARNTPFGGTIVHGFQLLSLLTAFLSDVWPWRSVDGADGARGSFSVNYGFNKVRFLKPVLVGSRVRCRFQLMEMTKESDGRTLSKIACTVEVEGAEKPVVIAEWLGMTMEAAL